MGKSHPSHELLSADWDSFTIRDGGLSFLDGYGPKLSDMPVAEEDLMSTLRAILLANHSLPRS
jgi:hypothetical protein